MKKLLTICSIAFALNAVAQPVIQDGSKVPSAGLNTAVLFGSAPNGPGPSGANQTWDFSNISMSSVGNYTVINSSTSAHASSFPGATYAYTLAGTYSYFKVSANKMEVLAYSITAPGSGNDYSPNPRTVLKFPFNYGDTLSDTWQKTGDSQNDVTITYDGYGTLITPTKTYTNVIRVKEQYDNGADYQWYLTDPLMSVFVYDHNKEAFYMIGADQATGISEEKNINAAVNIFPNPAQNILNISTTAGINKLEITDALGRTILVNDVINSTSAAITLPAVIQSGIYYVRIYSTQGLVTKVFVKE